MRTRRDQPAQVSTVAGPLTAATLRARSHSPARVLTIATRSPSAASCLGKLLIRREGRKLLAGRIVEDEAYLGARDPAAHGYAGLTRAQRGAVRSSGSCVRVLHLRQSLLPERFLHDGGSGRRRAVPRDGAGVRHRRHGSGARHRAAALAQHGAAANDRQRPRPHGRGAGHHPGARQWQRFHVPHVRTCGLPTMAIGLLALQRRRVSGSPRPSSSRCAS